MTIYIKPGRWTASGLMKASSGGWVVRCQFCGKLYKFYAFYAGDQSACPSCRREAEENK